MFTINGEDDTPFSGLKSENSIEPDQLIQIIGKYNDVEIIEENPITIRADIYELLITNRTIKAKSFNTINMILDELRYYSNVSESSVDLVVYDTSLIENELKKRLIATSKYQAEQTARIIDKQIGEIFEISV